ncbi:MAG: hypothetical protein WD904_05180 [Dehalococcoidia bacterium]
MPWLAAAADHGGHGAGDVSSTITLRVSVEDAGSAEVGIEQDVIES